jgi:hypothetical protein
VKPIAKAHSLAVADTLCISMRKHASCSSMTWYDFVYVSDPLSGHRQSSAMVSGVKGFISLFPDTRRNLH